MTSFNPSRFLTPSALVLIGANLLPLYGVAFLGWEVFPLILLFWLENVIIGVSNVFRLLFADPGSPGSWAGKIILIPFFTVHYGMFTAVHGVFVMLLFGGQAVAGAEFPDVDLVLDAIERTGLGIPILALGSSHAFSFFFNYIGKGEYRTAQPPRLMFQPYGRVVVMHLTLIGGGMLLVALRSPVAGLALLILLKIVIDVRAHLAERTRLGTSEGSGTATAATPI